MVILFLKKTDPAQWQEERMCSKVGHLGKVELARCLSGEMNKVENESFILQKLQRVRHEAQQGKGTRMHHDVEISYTNCESSVDA